MVYVLSDYSLADVPLIGGNIVYDARRNYIERSLRNVLI